jgi:proline dehydrogenase
MDHDLLKLGSDALKKAALNEAAKSYILSHPGIYNTLKKAANRYLVGETLSEAVPSIRKINQEGYNCTTDFMGESTRREKDAIEATHEFIALAKTITTEGLNSSISLDLSHIGMLVSKDLAQHHLKQICKEAQKAGKEVILSMEGIDRTDMIIDIYKNTYKNCSNLGITLQAYLHRTKEDFKEIIGMEGSIRLVKGAYEAPEKFALPRGKKLDEQYLEYIDILFSKNHPCSVATHHEEIQLEAIKLAACHKAGRYELEQLQGICNEQFAVLKEQGYPCRKYVVYGKEWYLYLCNRLAEHPMNIFQAAHDIINQD